MTGRIGMAGRITAVGIMGGGVGIGLSQAQQEPNAKKDAQSKIAPPPPITVGLKPHEVVSIATPTDNKQSKSQDMGTLIRAMARDVPEPFQRPASALFPALFATGLFYPINLIITLVQKYNMSVPEVIKRVTSGGTKPLGLWAGLSPILRNAALQRCAQFYVQGETKTWLDNMNPHMPKLNNLASGVAASLVDTFIMAPAEIKSMAAQIAKSSGEDPKHVIKTFSLGRGATAILARDMIANVFGFTLPQELREAWNMKHEIPQRLGTTFISLAMANVFTTPIDCIKTAVLTQKEMTAFAVVKDLWESNKLWSGYALRTVRQAGVFSLVFVGAESLYKSVFCNKKA
jgi:hypothetical protein